MEGEREKGGKGVIIKAQVIYHAPSARHMDHTSGCLLDLCTNAPLEYSSATPCLSAIGNCLNTEPGDKHIKA